MSVRNALAFVIDHRSKDSSPNRSYRQQQRKKVERLPYINREQRKAIDGLIDNLANAAFKLGKDETERAGILNYVVTRLTLRLIPQDRYWKIALTAGVFSNITSEFYRRLAAPYEDRKMKEQGDVFS